MTQKDLEKIIEDYDFAYMVAKRYGDKYTMNSMYELFDMLGYHTHNYDPNESFEMEIGDLLLTYTKGYGLDTAINIWFDNQWFDCYISDFKDNLRLAMATYKLYKKDFYKDHDTTDTPVSFDEFLDNEWQDDEIKDYYIKQLKGEANGHN